DTAEFYYHDLEGDAHMTYVPNVGHGMGGIEGGVTSLDYDNPVRMLLAWYMSVAQEKPLPEFTYTFEENGAIRVVVDPANPPINAYVWQATAEGARDFRNPNLGNAWFKQPLPRQMGGETGAYYVTPTILSPDPGNYTGYYIQLEYANEAELPEGVSGVGYTVPNLVFSTGVRVIPDVYPEFTGYCANEDTLEDPFVPSEVVSFSEQKMPVIVVYGTPYEMGNYYGQLLAPQINAFVQNYISFYLAQTGFTTGQLEDAWSLIAPYLDSRILEEMQGISEAEGVTVSLQQIQNAHAANLFEVLGSKTSAGTVIYRELSDSKSSALTASLNAQFYKNQCAVVYIPDEGMPHTVLTYAGLTFGRTGMNLGGISALEVVDLPVWDDETGTYIDPYTGEPVAFTGLEPNALSLVRAILYDALSLADAVDMVKDAPLQRPTTMLLSDGRNERRGARLRMYPGNLVLEERYDLARSDFEAVNDMGVLYGVNSVLKPAMQTALSDILVAPVTFADLLGIANMPPFAQPGANAMNVVLDGMGLNVFVTVAQEGAGGEYYEASTDNVEDFFNMQMLLP
ncbi:MAG: hypothetical protein KAH38_01540, partial [Candidatus Hydrogenedentes bacterium]|nr:hypothetical protein [Candidatus Hydrogenedentota bacterium]